MAADNHQLVRAIARGTITHAGARWFNITYCTRCKIYTTQDVTYAPDLTLPAVRLRDGASERVHAAGVSRRPARGDQAGPGKKADIVAMSNAEVLDRAIATANANGWKGSVVYPGVYRSPEQLIYSHDFARALWGKEAPNNYCKLQASTCGSTTCSRWL